MKIPEGYILVKESDYRALVKRNAELEELLSKCIKRIDELEARLNKTSNNSSKPPSSDGLKKVVKNNREKSNRKPGAQPGHTGSGLSLMKTIDKTIEHKLSGKCDCGKELSKGSIINVEHRQVIDFPEKLTEVRDHQVEVKKCSCGRIHKAVCDYTGRVQYGDRIKTFLIYCNQYQQIPYGRLQEFVGDMFGISISDGLIQSTISDCYENLSETENQIKEALLTSAVIHNDETGMRCENKTGWIHTASNQTHTLYFYHPKRGNEAIDAMGILPFYKGTSIHDRWSSYDKYDCIHGLCNSHLLRDLKFMHEEMNRPWAEELKELLQHANQKKQKGNITKHFRTRIGNQIESIVTKAMRREPRAESIPGKRGRKAKGKALCLLDVFRDRINQVLLFLEKDEVPFDNNLAERDLRMIKLKQKISGCFRQEKVRSIFAE